MEDRLSIPAAQAVFLSDAHLNGDDPDTHAFVALAEKAAAERIPLFLLGDIFDLWFGVPELTFPFQKPVIEKLRELRRTGLRLYYVEGNRDFHLKTHHEGTTLCVVAEEALRVAVGSRTVYLTHGDTVNRADLAYRFWKTVSKNRWAYGALSLVPPAVALPAANRLERTLRRTNRRFRGSFPERELREFALRMFDSGADVVIVGHFHSEHLEPFGEEPSARVFVALPSWKEDRRYFCLAADGTYGFRSFRPDAPLV